MRADGDVVVEAGPGGAVGVAGPVDGVVRQQGCVCGLLPGHMAADLADVQVLLAGRGARS